MSKIKLVKRKAQMTHRDIIKYQIMNHCFFSDIQLSNNELDCLTLLGIFDDIELSDFCISVVNEGIFKNPQTVRNFLSKAAKIKLIHKYTPDGLSQKKRIHLNKDLNFQTGGQVLLDYKFYHVTKE